MSHPNGNGAFSVGSDFFSVGIASQPPPAAAAVPFATNWSQVDVDTTANMDSEDNPFQTAQDALGPAAVSGIALATSTTSTASTTDPAAPSPAPATTRASKRSSTKTPAKASRPSKRPASSPAGPSSIAAASSSSSSSSSSATTAEHDVAPAPDQPSKPKRAKLSSAEHLKRGEAWANLDVPTTTPLLDQRLDLSLDRRSRRSATANINYNETKLSAAKEAAAKAAAVAERAAKAAGAKQARAAAVPSAAAAHVGEQEQEEQEEQEGAESTSEPQAGRRARKSRASGGKGKGKTKAKAAPAEPEALVDSAKQPNDHEHGRENGMDVDDDTGEPKADVADAPRKSKSKAGKKSAKTKQTPKSKLSTGAATPTPSKRMALRSFSAVASYTDPATDDDETELVNITSSPAPPVRTRSRATGRQTQNSAAARLDVANDPFALPPVPPTKTYGKKSGRSRASSASSLPDRIPTPAAEHETSACQGPSLPNERPILGSLPVMMGVSSESELSDLSDDERAATGVVDLNQVWGQTSLQPVQAPMEISRSRHSRNKQIRNSSAPTSPMSAMPAAAPGRTTRTSSRRSSAAAMAESASAASANCIATLESQLADLHTELTALRSASNQHALLTADLDAKRAEMDHLRADLQALHAELDHEQRKSAQFQEDVETLNANVLSLQARLADVGKELDVVTRQRDEYDVRLTQAETQLAKRTRGGGAYEFERSPVTVSNGLAGFKQALSAYCRAVLMAPVNKGRQAKEVFPKMVRAMREAMVDGAGGGIGYVPSGADEDGFAWVAATQEGVQAVHAMGNPVVGLSVATNAHLDLTTDVCTWPSFDIRISQAVSVLTAVTLHTLYALFADNPVDRSLRHASQTLSESLFCASNNGALDAAWAELRANAATAGLATAEVYYHAADLKAPAPPKHVQKLDLAQVQEDVHWARFFVRAREVMEQAYARVGVRLGPADGDDAGGLRARLDVLLRRFAVLWFMVPAIDPNWIVTFFAPGHRAPVAERFMPETVLEVEDGPSEDEEDRAALLVLVTAIPAVLVKGQDIVISPASGVRVVVPKELVGAEDQHGHTKHGDQKDVEMTEAGDGDMASNGDSGSDVEVLDVDGDSIRHVQEEGNGHVQMSDDQDMQTATGSDFSLASDLQLADRLLEQVQSPMITSGAFSSPPRGSSAALDAIISGGGMSAVAGASTSTSGDMAAEDLLLSFASSAATFATRAPSTTAPTPSLRAAANGMQPPSSTPAPRPTHALASAPHASTPDRRTSFIGSLGSSFMSYVTGSPSTSQQHNGSSQG